MADLGKLWFELGMRDNVIEQSKAITESIKALEAQIDKTSYKFKSLGQDKDFKHIKDIASALKGINEEFNHLNKSLNIDVKTDSLNGAVTLLNVLKGTLNGLKGDKGLFTENDRRTITQTLQDVRTLSKGYDELRERKRASNTNTDNAKTESGLRIVAQELIKVNRLYRELETLSKSIANSPQRLNLAPTFDNVKSRLESYRNSMIEQLQAKTPTYASDYKRADYMLEMDNFKNTIKGMSNSLALEREGMMHGIAMQARAENTARLEAKRGTQEQIQLNDKLAQSYAKITGSIDSQRNGLLALKDSFIATFSIQNLQNMASNLIEKGGNFDVQKTALKGVLRSDLRGDAIFNAVKEQSLTSPFTFSELSGYTKQLAAYQIPYEDLQGTMTRLADLSAGLGVDMNRLILAYGQVNTATVLRGQEVRQFTEAGVPILQALADQFTKLEGRAVTTNEVFDRISRKEVPFTMVKKAIEDMTNTGGQFYDMQLRLSDTLRGRYVNLQDAIEVLMGDFAQGGSVMGNSMKFAIESVTALIRGIHRLTPLLIGLGGAFALRGATRGLFGGLGVGLEALDRNLLKSKRLLANNILAKSATEGLNKAETAFLATKQQILFTDYRTLAATGQLNNMQVARLMTSAKITEEEAAELFVMNGLTKQQAMLLAMKGKELSLWNVASTQMKSQLGNMGTSLLESLVNPMMLATVGVSALIAGATYLYEQHEEERKRAEDYINNMTQRSKDIKDALAMEDETPPKTEDDYANRINSMRELLKQHSANYEAIMKHALGIDSLSKRYDYLREKLDTLKNEADTYGENAGIYEEATNGGLFGEHVSTNIKDYIESWQAYKKALNDVPTDKLNKFKDELENLAKTHKEFNKELYDKSGKPLPLEEQLHNMQGFYYGYKRLPKGVRFDELPDIGKNGYFNTIATAMTANDTSMRELENLISTNFDAIVAKAKKTVKEKGKKGEEYHEALRQEIVNMLRYDGVNTDEPFVKNMLNKVIYPYYSIHPLPELDANDFKDKTEDLADRILKELNRSLGGKAVIKKEVVVKLIGTTEDLSDAYHNARKAIDDAREKVELAKKMELNNSKDAKNIATYQKLVKELEESIKTYERIYHEKYSGKGLTEDRPTKQRTNSSSGKTKTDVALKELKDTERLYERYRSTYEKLSSIHGKDKALSILNENDEFKKLSKLGITDPEDIEENAKKFEGAYEHLHKVRVKDIERTHSYNAAKEKSFEKSTEAQIQSIKRVNDALQEQLRIFDKQWDRYKEWRETTGDVGLSAIMAFGKESVPYNNSLEALKASLLPKIDALNKDNKTTYNLDTLVAMPQTELGNLIGKDSTLYMEIKHYKDALEKSVDEVSKLWLEVYQSAKNYDARINKINYNYERRNSDLNKKEEELRKEAESKGEKYDPTSTNKLRKENDDYRDREIAKVKFEQFKDSDAWIKLFDNQKDLSLGTMRSIMSSLKEQQKVTTTANGYDPKDIKELTKAINDLQDRMVSISPFDTIKTSLSRGKALRQISKELSESGKDAYIATDSARDIKAGLIAGKSYNINDLSDEQIKAHNLYLSGIDKVVKGLNDFKSALDPIAELFEAMGNKKMGDALSVGGKAINSATSSMNAMRGLSDMFGGRDKVIGKALSNASPYIGAAMGVISLAGSVIKSVRNKGQEEYEATKKYNEANISVLNEINHKLAEQLKLSNQQLLNDVRKTDNNVASTLDSYRQMYEQRMNTHVDSGHKLRKDADEGRFGGDYVRYGVNATLPLIKAWESRGLRGIGNYYTQTFSTIMPELNRLLALRFNDKNSSDYFEKGKLTEVAQFARLTPAQLSYIKELVPELWAQMDSEARGHLDKIIEVGDEVLKRTKEITKLLTNIEYEDMYNGFVDMLTKLDGSFSDFSHDMEQKLRKAIIGSITTQVLGDKLKAIEKKAGEFARNDQALYDEYGHRISEITEDEKDTLLKMIKELENDNRRVRDLTDRFHFSSSASASSNNITIKGITEQQADLLLSYTNSIRAYFSQLHDRMNVQMDVSERQSNLLAEQVAVQKRIEANTLRGASATEELLNEIRSVITTDRNGKKLRF